MMLVKTFIMFLETIRSIFKTHIGAYFVIGVCASLIDISVFINFTSEWSPKRQFYEPKVIVPAGIISWRDLTPRNIELAVAKEPD